MGGPLRPLRRLHPSCTRSVSVWRPGPRAPTLFFVFVFSLPPSASEAPGRPLNERLKTLRPALGIFLLDVKAGEHRGGAVAMRPLVQMDDSQMAKDLMADSGAVSEQSGPFKCEVLGLI